MSDVTSNPGRSGDCNGHVSAGLCQPFFHNTIFPHHVQITFPRAYEYDIVRALCIIMGVDSQLNHFVLLVSPATIYWNAISRVLRTSRLHIAMASASSVLGYMICLNSYIAIAVETSIADLLLILHTPLPPSYRCIIKF